ncbi:hypothetical protein D9M71_769500 [compost metagenome]
MDEMDIQAIDMGDEVWYRVYFRFDDAPVIPGCPVAGQFLDRRQLNALGGVIDCFLVRPAGGCNASAQLRKIGFLGVKMKRTDFCFY